MSDADSIPQQTWDGALALLNTGRPDGIPEFTFGDLNQPDFINGPDSWASLYPNGEAVKPIGNKADATAVERPSTLLIEIRAKGSRSVNAFRQIETIRVWVVSKLGGAKLDGLVEKIIEAGTKYGISEGDPPHAIASQYFNIDVPTLINDLTKRPGRPS